MTREEIACIDDLIEWLDNQADGAPDAGALANNATNWHPALVALRSRHSEAVHEAFREGWLERGLLPDAGICPSGSCEPAWQASDAKARLT